MTTTGIQKSSNLLINKNPLSCCRCSKVCKQMRKCPQCLSFECRQCYNGLCFKCNVSTVNNFSLNDLRCEDWESMLVIYKEHIMNCDNKEIHLVSSSTQTTTLNTPQGNSNQENKMKRNSVHSHTPCHVFNASPSVSNEIQIPKDNIIESSNVDINSEVSFMNNKNELIACSSKDGKIHLIDTESLTVVNTITTDYLSVSSMIYIGNDKVAALLSDNTIKTYHLTTGQLLSTFKGSSATVTQIVSLNNSVIGSVDILNVIITWKSDTNEIIKLYESEHNGAVNAFINLNNGMLATASVDTKIKVRKVRTGQHVYTLHGHTESVNCLTTISNNLIASGSDDTTVRIWNILKGTLVRIIYTGRVTSLLNINNRSIAVGNKNSIKIIHPESGDIIKILEETVGFVNFMISLKNGVLAISGDDAMVKLWKLESATVLKCSPLHKSAVTGLVNVK